MRMLYQVPEDPLPATNTFEFHQSPTIECKMEYDSSFPSSGSSTSSVGSHSPYERYSALSVEDPFTPSSGRSTPPNFIVDSTSSSRAPAAAYTTPPPSGDEYYFQQAPQTGSPTSSHIQMMTCNFQQFSFSPTQEQSGLDMSYSASGLDIPLSAYAPMTTYSDHGVPLDAHFAQKMTVTLSDMCIDPHFGLESPMSDTRVHIRGLVQLPPSPDTATLYHLQMQQQQHQQQHRSDRKTPRSQARNRSTRPRRAARSGSGGSMNIKRSPGCDDDVQEAPAAKNICSEPGCGKAYVRSEHLKRHTQTHHSLQAPERCPFCPDPKNFSRLDNFRQHLKLHSEERAGSQTRVRYDPRAGPTLEAMKAQMRRCSGKKKNFKGRRRTV